MKVKDTLSLCIKLFIVPDLDVTVRGYEVFTGHQSKKKISNKMSQIRCFGYKN